ncbi:MAG: hypothetical protein BAA04_08110 [Firmicutes bacterium ZCTH02-B6]|nr:MAG: hypothetical protein BAA04_08110 [Firmicutes bacterium ZCTH02-B6]
MSDCRFPAGFLWGAATSAYQVEGAVAEDGRGESIWDRFCREPGRIEKGDTGDIACDHYHRWRDDIELMRRLGLTSYRFSVAWPRVFPSGKGQPNKAGLAFYERLVDALLAAGIRPLVTLYHWDLPAALQDRGGWTNRDTAYRFRDYAAFLFERLGDRVDLWLTVNEPYVAAMVGHALGIHAPGLKDLGAAVRAAHHLLLGHGLAVEAFDDLGMRKAGRGQGPARIGLSLDIHAYAPATDRDADVEAMERARTLEARWFVDPVLLGRYPADGLEWYKGQGVEPPVKDEDMALISRPIDIFGLNYYRRHTVVHDSGRPFFGYRVEVPPGRPVTELGWEVYPQGLYQVLAWLRDTYLRSEASSNAASASGMGRQGPAAEQGLPRPIAFFVTENGAAYPDVPEPAPEPGQGKESASQPNGVRIRDTQRRDYIAAHLYHVWRAIQDGIPVEGYWAWALMDNFEWAKGYSSRFGLVYVDYTTQERIIKDSGHWYSVVCQGNGLNADPERLAG